MAHDVPCFMRRGFTLVEAIVALVLLQVGILALVASGAATARQLALATRRTRASAIAAGRVERVRTNRCPAPASGRTDRPDGITEYWRVETLGPARVITDSVVYPLPRARRSRTVVRSWSLCRN